MKQAYAIFDNAEQELFANSVHDTPQGALVNGLLLCFGYVTPAQFNYRQIKAMWDLHNTKHRYSVVVVEIAKVREYIDEDPTT